LWSRRPAPIAAGLVAACPKCRSCPITKPNWCGVGLCDLLYLKLTASPARTDANHYPTSNYAKRSLNQNTNPDAVGIPQFCIFNFDFCILKLTVGQFELYVI